MAFFRHIRKAITNLNPEDIRAMAARPVHIGIVAPTQESMWRIESFLCPPWLPPEKRAETAQKLHRIAWADGTRGPFDLEIWDDSLAMPQQAFAFDAANPDRMVNAVVRKRQDIEIALAHSFPPFRKRVIEQIIGRIAKENAAFSLATALPDIVPILSLPWVAGEFATDTAFLTMNQIRMIFLIAAASERQAGYREQKGEIASVIAGAFGFRAIARELAGKIPFGGGLIPKAAVAYAGTQLAGRSIERVFREGSGFSAPERRALYDDALERGKQVVAGLLNSMRGRQLAATRGE